MTYNTLILQCGGHLLAQYVCTCPRPVWWTPIVFREPFFPLWNHHPTFGMELPRFTDPLSSVDGFSDGHMIQMGQSEP